MSREEGVRSGDIFTAFRSAIFRVGDDLARSRIAKGPAVIGAVFQCIKRLVRLLQTQMIDTLTRCPQKIADPFQPDRVSQAACKFPLLRAIGVHFYDACPDFFFLNAGVAT